MAFHWEADSLRDVIFSYLKAWKGYTDRLCFSLYLLLLMDGFCWALSVHNFTRAHLVQIPETSFTRCNMSNFDSHCLSWCSYLIICSVLWAQIRQWNASGTWKRKWLWVKSPVTTCDPHFLFHKMGNGQSAIKVVIHHPLYCICVEDLYFLGSNYNVRLFKYQVSSKLPFHLSVVLLEVEVTNFLFAIRVLFRQQKQHSKSFTGPRSDCVV